MDAILGFISANMVFIGFVWGLILKYVPALAKFPNALIPYVNAILALLTGLAGPSVAHAAGLIPEIGGGGFFAHILNAVSTAIQSALLYEVFARHPLKAAGINKAQA